MNNPYTAHLQFSCHQNNITTPAVGIGEVMRGKAGEMIPFLGREGDFFDGVEGRYMSF